jgi:hypothetical protein
MNGKGDTPRPLAVEPDDYARRWAATFGRATQLLGLLDKPVTVTDTASHEPDPSGGQQSR